MKTVSIEGKHRYALPILPFDSQFDTPFSTDDFGSGAFCAPTSYERSSRVCPIEKGGAENT